MKIRLGHETGAGISFLPHTISEKMLIVRITQVNDKLLNMMERLKSYSPGVSFVVDRDFGNETDMEELLRRAEVQANLVIQGQECRDLITEVTEHQHGHDISILDQEGNFDFEAITSLVSILGSAGEYLDAKYSEDKLFQKEKMKKVINLLRIYYALLITAHLREVNQKLAAGEDKVSLFWNCYEIGILQGELNMIALLVDQEIIDLQAKMKSSVSRKRGWLESEMKAALDGMKADSKEIAENLWNTDDDKDTPHHELAEYIYDEALKAKYEHLRDYYVKDYLSKGITDAEGRADEHLKEVIRSAIITPAAKEKGLIRGTKEYKEKSSS